MEPTSQTNNGPLCANRLVTQRRRLPATNTYNVQPGVLQSVQQKDAQIRPRDFPKGLVDESVNEKEEEESESERKRNSEREQVGGGRAGGNRIIGNAHTGASLSGSGSDQGPRSK